MALLEFAILRPRVQLLELAKEGLAKTREFVLCGVLDEASAAPIEWLFAGHDLKLPEFR